MVGKGMKNYTAGDMAKIYAMFNNGDPLQEIAEAIGTTEIGIFGKISKEHAYNPDVWDTTRIREYRSAFHQQHKEALNKGCSTSRMVKRMRNYVRFVGYQMASISRENGYVRVEIEDDAVSPGRIYTCDLRKDFGQHVKKALAYGEADRRKGDRRRFKDLPEEIHVGPGDVEDDSVVIIGFDRNGIDEATGGKMDNFLDLYCSLLNSEKKIEMKMGI